MAFEYKYVKNPVFLSTEELQKFGDEGWEIAPIGMGPDNQVHYLLKRQKVEEVAEAKGRRSSFKKK